MTSDTIKLLINKIDNGDGTVTLAFGSKTGNYYIENGETLTVASELCRDFVVCSEIDISVLENMS